MHYASKALSHHKPNKRNTSSKYPGLNRLLLRRQKAFPHPWIIGVPTPSTKKTLVLILYLNQGRLLLIKNRPLVPMETVGDHLEWRDLTQRVLQMKACPAFLSLGGIALFAVLGIDSI
ncbi:hypothetical protein CEXT_331031 [Caerostris extrusa]|uniref:Uncharacterized protein n=1 Tax=Caerostris extrusa TaxID=172846 RepID=A0AAV4VA87_CAEEX|nr:hypothetical protein CEXT_331031 [Caerostris extrusa]